MTLVDERSRWSIRGRAFRLLARFERIATTDYRLRYSPTFIVGPARSGTTLVRQLVAWGLGTCHFTNLLAESQLHLGYPLPIAAAKIVKWLHGSPPMDRHFCANPFHNHYGQIRGKSAPTEGEMIWGYWLGTRYGPVEPDGLSQDNAQAMYRAVAATERIFGLPFVNKTTTLSLRLRVLERVFPEALFIRVSRDPVDTAQSILRARQDDYPDWLGARPRECRGVDGEPLVHQVCKQVFYVNKHLERAQAALGNDRFLRISYQGVCHDPRGELERISLFMRRHRAPVRPMRQVPESFRFSHGAKSPESDYGALRDCLQQLARREGEEWAQTA
jgi:hypothetical protein